MENHYEYDTAFLNTYMLYRDDVEPVSTIQARLESAEAASVPAVDGGVAYTDYYIPKETLYTHANAQMYQTWAAQGHLHICGESVIDYEQIGQDIMNNSRYLNILSVGYDAYRNRDLTNYLKAQGVKCLRAYKQTYANFVSPVEAFESLIYNRKIHIADNPITPWMLDNVAIDEDSMKNKKPIKKSANKKIDGVVCMLMSLGQFMEWKR